MPSMKYAVVIAVASILLLANSSVRAAGPRVAVQRVDDLGKTWTKLDGHQGDFLASADGDEIAVASPDGLYILHATGRVLAGWTRDTESVMHPGSIRGVTSAEGRPAVLLDVLTLTGPAEDEQTVACYERAGIFGCRLDNGFSTAFDRSAIPGFVVGSPQRTPRPAAPTEPSSAPPRSSARVVDIRARLYYESTGEVDPRDITQPGVSLWNTVIGEGDARLPSKTIFVDIRIRDPGQHWPKGRLHVRVLLDGRLDREHSFDLGDYTYEAGTLVLPLLVVGGGCSTVKLEAALEVARRVTSRHTEVITFECGD